MNQECSSYYKNEYTEIYLKKKQDEDINVDTEEDHTQNKSYILGYYTVIDT